LFLSAGSATGSIFTGRPVCNDGSGMRENIIEAALEAGDLLLQAASDGVWVKGKGTGHELVTSADLASQELLQRRLLVVRPDAAFVGEEDWDGRLPDGPCWIVDPLDGTNNFAHGYPVWSVSIAFSEGGGVIEAACVHDATRRETFSAVRGGGTLLNGRPVAVTTTDKLSSSLLATGFPYHRSLESAGADLGVLDYFLRRVQGIRRGGSAAIDLAYVACGRLDGFWEEHLKPWDMAAGTLLVEEAGGEVSSYGGGIWTPASGGIVASGPRVHRDLVSGIEESRHR
jgi:myo-inositol-1(or 4)-monophosphatase